MPNSPLFGRAVLLLQLKYMKFKRLFLLLPLLAAFVIAPTAQADVNSFSILSFTADYYLNQADDGSSTMRVQEQIVANFPDVDQNHGIERALPNDYDGHPIDLKVESVRDDSGKDLHYQTNQDSGNTVLRIGDADTFIHGPYTYNIIYTYHNVTKNFADHDELYWDVNGDQWSQPFNKVTARLHLPTNLAAKLKPEPTARCFVGTYGSTINNCQLSRTATSTETVLSFQSIGQLGPAQTLTFVTGFNKGTFAPYHPSLQTILIGILIGAGIVLPPIITAIILFINWRRHGRDAKGRGVIVPQYLPPKETSVIGSQIILKEKFQSLAISAQIIDLAIRHYIKVYDQVEQKALRKTHNYELELLKLPTDLRAEEKDVIDMLFGEKVVVGKKVKLKDLANKLYKDASAVGKRVSSQLAADGYFVREPVAAARLYYIVGGVLMFASFFLMPFSLGFTISGILLLIFAHTMPARTAKGVELRDYLLGLRDYMKLAEEQRLKILQSPNGAVAGNVEGAKGQQIVKLYERILPYAMLFGIEKQWAKQFVQLYDQPPDWYAGNLAAWQAGAFVGALSSFNSATINSFSPPNSSSGSGFSGGGFAGGGGGGGGGGGW